MLLGLKKLLVSILALFLMLQGMSAGTGLDLNAEDKAADYIENVDKIEMLENTVITAVPQTAVYGIIKNHLEDKSGNKEKKAIVIGYDGCRLDVLNFIDEENSAIADVLGDNGTALISYCGGKNFPLMNTQETSTGPGWCSMLTGAWSDVTGVGVNGVEKADEPLTLLTSSVLDGTADKSAFYVSWDGHFSSPGMTYYSEKQYVEENGINVDFVCSSGDAGTLQCTLDDLAEEDCSDFIFLTLEFTDHAGHSTGYCIKNPEYREAFADAESYGKMIVDAVKARPSYDSEDWLIMVTSDHGGYNTSHGLYTIQERMTFIVTNKQVEYALPGKPVC